MICHSHQRMISCHSHLRKSFFYLLKEQLDHHLRVEQVLSSLSLEQVLSSVHVEQVLAREAAVSGLGLHWPGVTDGVLGLRVTDCGQLLYRMHDHKILPLLQQTDSLMLKTNFLIIKDC